MTLPIKDSKNVCIICGREIPNDLLHGTEYRCICGQEYMAIDEAKVVNLK